MRLRTLRLLLTGVFGLAVSGLGAEAKTEKIATLEHGWVLAQDKEQGRCVIQSPPMNIDGGNGVMLINLTSAKPDQPVFTFTHSDWNITTGRQDGPGTLAIHQQSLGRDLGDLFGGFRADERIPIWLTTSRVGGLDVYEENRGGTSFITAIVPYIGLRGEDPETGERRSLYDFLTDPKYSAKDAGLLLDFKNTIEPKDRLYERFVVPLWAIPNLTPLLQCIK